MLYAKGIIELLLPLQREMSIIMLNDNSGLVPHCGRFGPNMTTITMGGHCCDIRFWQSKKRLGV